MRRICVFVACLVASTWRSAQAQEIVNQEQQADLPAPAVTPIIIDDYPVFASVVDNAPPTPTTEPPIASLTTNPLATFNPDDQPVLYSVPGLDKDAPPVNVDASGQYDGIYVESFPGQPQQYAVPVHANMSYDTPESGAARRRGIHARQSSTTKCPGTTVNYNVSYALANFPATLRGAWLTVYPSYPISGANTARNPPATMMRFERLDNNINLNMGGNDNYPNWTSFSPVAYTVGSWKDKLLFDWNFRIIVPCSGNYSFQISGDDGVALYINSAASLVEKWADQACATYTSSTIYLTAGSLLPARMLLYENSGSVCGVLRWRLPGSSTYDIIPQAYLIPHQGPKVVITSNNIISFNSTTGVEEFWVRLSDPPTGTVTVTINNAALKDIFGFDKCQLTFTSTNWMIPQVVHVAKVPGAKRTLAASNSAAIVSLEASTDSAGKSYAPGTLQVVNPSPSGGTLGVCQGWGDPHYVTWDGVSFSFYYQGTYYLARDYPGNFAVMTYLAKCDSNTSITCTKDVYVQYKGSLYHIYMNQGASDTAYTDPMPYVVLARGGNDGVIVSLPASNLVRLTIPGGIEVDIRVGFYKTWLPVIRTWWRYFLVYVKVDDRWKLKATGLCGNNNGLAADDDTLQTTLAAAWNVTNIGPILSGNGSIVPLQAPSTTNASQIFSYATNVTMDNFTFDTACSDAGVPNPVPVPVSPTPIPNPPPVDDTPVPPANLTCNANVIAACATIIKSTTACPINATTVTALRTACCRDMMLAGGSVPTGNDLTILADAYTTQCEVKSETTQANACSKCSVYQTCTNGTCVATSLQCGGTCIGGTCNTTSGTCSCNTGYRGQFCEIGPPMCRLPDDFGPFVNGSTCRAGNYLQVGQSCSVSCQSGANQISGSNSYTCGPTGSFSAIGAITCIKWTTCGAQVGTSYVCDRGYQSVPETQCLLPNGCDATTCCAIRAVGSVSPTEYDNKGICTKTLRIMLTNGDLCSYDHTITINNIGVYCSIAYSGADCPLGPDPTANMDNSTQFKLTIKAAQFCDGSRALVINGAITIISYMPYKAYTRDYTRTPDRNFFFRDVMYYLLAFDKERSLRVFNMRALSFKTKLGQGGTYIQPSFATAVSMPEANSNGVFNGQVMGFDRATQTHVMRMTLDTHLVEDSSGNGLLPEVIAPPQQFDILAQLVFSVDYESARRRRRQADSDTADDLQSGQAAMSTMATYAPDDSRAEPTESSAPSIGLPKLYSGALVGTLLCLLLSL